MTPLTLLLLAFAQTDAFGDPLPPGAVARLGTIRFRHDRSILVTAYSSDGKSIVSGSGDGTFRTWEAATGKEIRRVAAVGRGFVGAAFSRNGKTAAAVSDKDLFVFDLEGAREILKIPAASASRIDCVALSDDGKLVVAGGTDSCLRSWQVPGGQPGPILQDLKKLRENITAAAFSPDGSLLAYNARFRTVVVETATGNEIKSFTTNNASDALAFSPDGKVLACGAGQLLLLWETGTWMPRFKGEVSNFSICSLAFSQDGARIAAGNRGPAIRIFSASTGAKVAEWKTQELFVNSVAFAPDGKALASGGTATFVRAWNPSTGEELTPRPVPEHPISALSFSPDGKTLAAGGHSTTILLCEAGSGKLLRSLPGHAGHVSSLAFLPDSARLASGSYDGTVRLWNPRDGTPAWSFDSKTELRGDTAIYSVAVSADGKRLAATGAENRVRLWDLPSMTRLPNDLRAQPPIYNLCLSADGTLAATRNEDRDIHLWNVNDASILFTLPGFKGLQGNIALSPDGKTLAMGGSRGCRLWNTTTGKEWTDLQRPSVSLIFVAFSPDGATLASFGYDSMVHLWRVSDGAPAGKFDGNVRKLRALAFSPDGKKLAVAGETPEVLIWNVPQK